jgi:hypothetical protein
MKTFYNPLILLCCILFLASFTRFYGIFTNSFAFTYDAGRDMLAVAEIVKTHKIPLIGPTTGLEGVFYGPWWYVFILPSFIISSGNPQGVTFFIAITGVISVGLAFFTGKKIQGDMLGLFFAFLVAFSPDLIGTSSQIWNPNLLPFFLSIFLLIQYYIFTDKKKLLLFFLFGLVGGLLMDLEIVLGGLIFGSSLLANIILRKKNIHTAKQYIVSLIGFGIILLPRIIFDLRHNFLMTNALLTLKQHGAAADTLPITVRFKENLLFLFELWNNTISGKNAFIGSILFVLIVASIFLLYKKAPEREKKFVTFLAIVMIVFYIGISVFGHAIYGHYFTGIPIFLSLFISIIFLWWFRSFGKKVLLIILCIFFITSRPWTFNTIIASSRWEGDASVYRNQINVVDYVYAQANKKPFYYDVYTPPIHAYPYTYLFAWYGNKKYGYIPNEEKNNLIFFILEEDKQYPTRLTKWLQERKNDGKIIKENILTGNITVQTRVQ